MIKAVLFDLGNTLIEVPDPCPVYQEILKAHGITRNIKEISKAHDQATREFPITLFPKLVEFYWPRFNTLVAKKLGATRNPDKIGQAIDREWWNHAKVAIYPDVEPTLIELRNRKLKLGIITNALEKDIDALMRKTSLPDLFDAKIGTDTFNLMKPDAQVFLKTIKVLKARPPETLFVGDRLEEDYKGAKRAGLQAFLIDRSHVHSRANSKTIHTITQLLNYI